MVWLRTTWEGSFLCHVLHVVMPLLPPVPLQLWCINTIFCVPLFWMARLDRTLDLSVMPVEEMVPTGFTDQCGYCIRPWYPHQGETK